MTISVVREPEIVPVEIGPWTAQSRGDELANIAYRGRQVLRGIRFVVRDHDWRTVPPRVTAISVTRTGLELRVRYTAWAVDYESQITVSLDGDRLRVVGEGTALSGFQRNRIGFVVLHYSGDSGREATVTRPDGTSAQDTFPAVIAAHQPFRDIAAFSWCPDGAFVDIDFDGDVVEMEDQRNWSDASFKTYSTPLSDPFPVPVSPGDSVVQTITLSARTVDSTFSPLPVDCPLQLVPPPMTTLVPLLGTLALGRDGASELVGWSLGFLMCEVLGAAPDAAEQIDRAVSDARKIGCPLDLRIVLPATDEQSARAGIALLLDRVPIGQLVRLAVFDSRSHVSEPALHRAAMAALADRPDDVSLVAGTRAHFAELNRTNARLPSAGLPLTFSLTPQMHAYELAHVIDSLSTHRIIRDQAAAIAEGAPLHVGPVTLEARFNAVATADLATPDEVVDHDDLYSHPAAAPWTLAAIAGLSGPEVSSLTLFSASGPRGLVDGGRSTLIGEVIRRVSEYSGQEITASILTSDTIALAVGDSIFVGDLAGTGRYQRIALGDQRFGTELAPWGIVELSARHSRMS